MTRSDRDQMAGGRWIEQMRGRQTRLQAAYLGALLLLSGCGVGSPPRESSPQSPAPADTKRQQSAEASVAQPTASNSSSATSGPAQAASSDGESRSIVRTDAQGRKWLGDVPYDVFFDDPLAVAAEGKAPERSTDEQARKGDRATSSDSSTSRAASQPSASAETAASEKPGPSAAVGSTADSWKRLVEMDVLDAEVKRIRNELTAALPSVSKYNGHYQEISVLGATLAAVAEIACEHSGDVSWKSNAPIVRDLGAKIHDASSALGTPAFQATKVPYEQLVDALDGNVPAGLPPSEPKRDFAQVANRSGVMKRMDRAFQWLKKNGSTPQAIEKESAKANHEASLLAALSHVIVAGHYDSADDAKYKVPADELTKAAEEIVSAVKSQNASGYGEAVARVQKRCDACHADFRF